MEKSAKFSKSQFSCPLKENIVTMSPSQDHSEDSVRIYRTF